MKRKIIMVVILALALCMSAQAATKGEQDALNAAKNYLKVMPFSHTSLIKQLEFEGFSTKDATYGADNCKANWKEQALKAANDYVKLMAISRAGLLNQLVHEGFVFEEISYAADKCKVDWNEQAVKAAKQYMEISSFSREELIEQLTSEYGGRFTAEQAEYAVSQLVFE